VFNIFKHYDLKENLFLLSEKHFGERLRIRKNGKRKPPISAVNVKQITV